MQINKLSSAAMAAAAAMLFTSAISTTAFAADAATMKCTGVNSCKGTSECKSAKNSCKGMNSCKGQGWVSLSKSACTDAKAKVKADAAKFIPIITGIYEICFFIVEAVGIVSLTIGWQTCIYPYKPQPVRRQAPVVFPRREFGIIQLISAATTMVFEWCTIVCGIFLGRLAWGHWPWLLGEAMMTLLIGVVLHVLGAVWVAMLETQYYIRKSPQKINKRAEVLCWTLVALIGVCNLLAFIFCMFIASSYWNENAMRRVIQFFRIKKPVY